MSSDFFCRFCQVQCTGQAPYDQHIASAKHLKKMRLASESSLNESSSADFNFEPLNVSRTPSIEKDQLSSFGSLLPSDTTISKETMRILLEWNHPMNYKPFCEVCQLVLHGEGNATIHFSSENSIHREKINNFKRISEENISYSCSICAEIFNSEYLMVTHFYSDSHDETRKRKVLVQKFIRIYETFHALKKVRAKRLRDSPVTDPSFSTIKKSRTEMIFNLDSLEKAIQNVKMTEEALLTFD